MKNARLQHWLAGILILLCGGGVGMAQETARASRIEISTRVGNTKVPLNRTVALTITLSWLGEPERYAVNGFDNPALSNFDIVGTATVNRSEVSNGSTTVYKDYVYTLRPRELGMAYVQGVVINCRDNLLEKDESLVTQRIPVEIIDPVADPADRRSLWIFLMTAVLIAAGAAGVVHWRRRRQSRMEADAEMTAAKPAGEIYLEHLRREINLDAPNLRDDFNKVSRFLRHFLIEIFRDHHLEGTTDELVAELGQTELEAHQVKSVQEILHRCDEIKFSGVEGTRDELTRYYTLFEGLLQFSLHREDVIEPRGKPEIEE